MKKKETKLQELERRIKYLEDVSKPQLPSYTPPYPQPYIPQGPINPHNPNLHYHGTMPCYNNPCIWC